MARYSRNTRIKGSLAEMLKDSDVQVKATFEILSKNHLNNIKNSAKANVVEKTGTLKKSIAVKYTETKNGAQWGGVGIDASAVGLYENGELYRPHKIAHFVENGFNHPHAGEIKGSQFMERAVAANGGDKAAEDLITKSLKIMEKTLEGVK